MYIKVVKKSGKRYKYYYHNIKEQGRVKNIFLSNNKQEAGKDYIFYKWRENERV